MRQIAGMEMRELAVPDAHLLTPHRMDDPRGTFFELYRSSILEQALNRPFRVAQINFSTSRRGILRGVHATITPPGQAKIVTCVRGAILDAVIDLRIGSPTFGAFELTQLDSGSGNAVCVAEGLGHAFMAMSDDACVGYLCSTEFVPGTQVDVNPLDPDLGLPWHRTIDSPQMSTKDRNAMSLAAAIEAGVLPTYEQCRQLYARLCAGPAVR